MTHYQEFTLAAVQAAPIPFDREASTEKACRLIEEAAARGATLAAFGETWLPGYPFFAFSSPGPLWWKAAAEYLANAVEIPSPTTDRLCGTARRAGIDVVIGVVELDPRTRGTVYCTLLFIGRDGAILGRHRKLKPTHAERAIWGEGDARGLRTYDRPYGRLSGLNCWEHNMVLPGYALMAQGTQVHVAAWPGREPSVVPPAPVSVWPRQLLLSRAFASQAAAYVVMVGGVRLPDDTPERYRELATFHHTGDSAIIDPRGEIIAGPAKGETILTAHGSLEAVLAAKAGCDVGGHYSRPDILQLHIDGRPLERAVGLAASQGPLPAPAGCGLDLAASEPERAEQERERR
ncbi:MAG: carbon-nitrogen hydrolase family protein [Candidatus Rokubacteria bacterium]|nr:carbon-nitrogen hydrolase family protein [Candidatus Rokubacteria bacterium]